MQPQREQNRLANLKRGDQKPESLNSEARGRAAEVVAKEAGVSPDTVYKVKTIEREADEPTKAQLRQGERSIHSVYQALRPSPVKAPTVQTNPMDLVPIPAPQQK